MYSICCVLNILYMYSVHVKTANTCTVHVHTLCTCMCVFVLLCIFTCISFETEELFLPTDMYYSFACNLF